MQQIPQNQNKSSGRWTKQEHQRFMYAIMQYGKDWKKVQQYVKTRSGSQVRSHAQKFFNKLEKINHNPPKQAALDFNRRQNQFSETEFDIQRQMNNQATPSTPMQLVSFIKKHSVEEGGKINLTSLKKNLQMEQQKPITGQNSILPNSFKSMSNILSAYEQISKQDTSQDESFFISITKKYKKIFKQVEDFDRLIDLHKANASQQQVEISRNRKRSFTLPEGSELDGEEMQEKIQQIKKRININSKQGEEKKERRSSENNIPIIMPPLNKLSTIHQQPREEDEIHITGSKVQAQNNNLTPTI